MTAAEFDTWFDYHVNLYPGIKSWLGKMTEGERRGILGAWSGVLRNIAMEDAEAASESMYGRERQPAAYERHAAVVRNLSYESADQRKATATYAKFHGESYACSLCMDVGMVSVQAFGEIREKATRMYGEEKVAKINQAIACECEAGHKSAKASGVARIDMTKHVLRQHRGVQSGDATDSDWENFRVAMCGVGKNVARREKRKVSEELEKLAIAAGFPSREPGCDDGD